MGAPYLPVSGARIDIFVALGPLREQKRLGEVAETHGQGTASLPFLGKRSELTPAPSARKSPGRNAGGSAARSEPTSSTAR